MREVAAMAHNTTQVGVAEAMPYIVSVGIIIHQYIKICISAVKATFIGLRIFIFFSSE